MKWTVKLHRNAHKQMHKLPKKIAMVLNLLMEDLTLKGPNPGKCWPNYGKLISNRSADKRHCHLIKGNPTYVACWQVLDKKIRLMEVYYVGTHEKAPY